MRTNSEKYDLKKDVPNDYSDLCVVDDKALCPVFDSSEEWVQAYKEQFGEEPSFF